MKILLPAIIFPMACLTLGAQTTGQLSGKVTTKAGKPVANAQITLSRIGISWTKTIISGENGSYMQVGLDPKEYDLVVKAEGFAPMQPARIKIPLGTTLVRDIVLFTPEEARAVAGAQAPADPGAAAANAGADAFNKGVALFNQQPPAFSEALPFFESAYGSLKDSLAKTTDEKMIEDTKKQLPTIERVYGISAFEVGKADPERKAQLWATAEPLLTKSLALAPKDQRLLTYLMEYHQFKGNAEEAKKYQAALDAILGPRPELAYNAGVEAFNAGKMSEAKAHLQKAIATDPKFPKSYYLLGMVEFGLNNLKATKENLTKYLELAPNGDKAGEVKEMLADPSLKRIK